MTDISDQDRRAAREWADEMSGYPILNENARAAVRYVLATVDAPAPTLADELRDLTVQWPLDPATMDVTKPRLDRLTTLADRVEQIEQERDDLARARESQEKALHEHGRLLSEARAEVELLTAERDRIATGRHITYAEMDGEPLPDPADVKPGEAWLVEVDGEKRTAMKDNGAGVPWNTIATNGVFRYEGDDDVTLITRLVPAPRVITDPDDLDRAKRDTVIRDTRGVICSRDSMGHAWTTFTSLADQRRHIILPATVLWEPGQELK